MASPRIDVIIICINRTTRSITVVLIPPFAVKDPAPKSKLTPSIFNALFRCNVLQVISSAFVISPPVVKADSGYAPDSEYAPVGFYEQYYPHINYDEFVVRFRQAIQ